MNNFKYNLDKYQAYLKFIISFLVLFYSGLVMSQGAEACSKLECMDEIYINKHFVKYYNVLNKTLIEARGCNDAVKLDNVLEFTNRIVKSTGSRERMAKFIEREFINNPSCILSAMKRISKDARNAVSLYLAKPSPFNKGKIKPILQKYEQQFPEEIKLIFIRKEISNIESK